MIDVKNTISFKSIMKKEILLTRIDELMLEETILAFNIYAVGKAMRKRK